MPKVAKLPNGRKRFLCLDVSLSHSLSMSLSLCFSDQNVDVLVSDKLVSCMFSLSLSISFPSIRSLSRSLSLEKSALGQASIQVTGRCAHLIG